MALTIAHPSIVPIFRSLVRKRVIDLPALCVGTIVPDLGEWTNRAALSDRAHSWSGMVTTVLPLGIVLLFLYHLLRRPLFFTFPNPHRQYFSDSRALNRLPLYPGAFASVLVGILLGSCCHLLWDSVTEANGHFVYSFHAFRKVYGLPAWAPLQGTISTFLLLNLATSSLGILFALFAYRSWCQSRRVLLPHPYAARDFDRWRWYFWSVGLLVSTAQGIPSALPLLGRDPDIYRFSLFWHHWGTSFLASLVSFATIGSLIVYFAWGLKSRRPPPLDKR